MQDCKVFIDLRLCTPMSGDSKASPKEKAAPLPIAKQPFQAVALPRPPPPPKSSESTVVNEAPVPAARSKWAPKADGAEGDGGERLLSREEVMLERMADVVVRKVAQFLPPPAGQVSHAQELPGPAAPPDPPAVPPTLRPPPPPPTPPAVPPRPQLSSASTR